MRLFYFLLLIIFFNNCSFDNKTGIWKNENSEIFKKAKDPFGDFTKFTSSTKSFDKTVKLDQGIKINIFPAINNLEWKDIFFKKNNNLSNFLYNDSNEIKVVGKKLSRYKIEKYLLYKNGNLIASDLKGNIIIYSIKNNIIQNKFNFYKKKYKKVKKKLNLLIDNNIIYVSDNLGYLYAYNYEDNKIIWAKNYKVPFRANLKISGNKLISANQDNNLIFFNKSDGNILKLIPTEENSIKNEFINNLSLNNKNLYFLNSFGSLYSINIENMEVIWFVNLNQSIDLNPSNLFLSNQVVNNNNIIIVSSNKLTYMIDSESGSILKKYNFSSEIKPIINGEYVFQITKNNFLICVEINRGNIVYSYDLNQLIADFLKTKKKDVIFRDFFLLNNNIYIFLKNSYYLKLNIKGELIDINKLPSKINSSPIVIDRSLLFLNKNNKIVITN